MDYKIDLGKVGITPGGAWDKNTKYERLTIVSYNNTAYLSKVATKGNTPGIDEQYWMPLVSGSNATEATMSEIRLAINKWIADLGKDEGFEIDSEGNVTIENTDGSVITIGHVNFPESDGAGYVPSGDEEGVFPKNAKVWIKINGDDGTVSTAISDAMPSADSTLWNTTAMLKPYFNTAISKRLSSWLKGELIRIDDNGYILLKDHTGVWRRVGNLEGKYEGQQTGFDVYEAVRGYISGFFNGWLEETENIVTVDSEGNLIIKTPSEDEYGLGNISDIIPPGVIKADLSNVKIRINEGVLQYSVSVDGGGAPVWIDVDNISGLVPTDDLSQRLKIAIFEDGEKRVLKFSTNNGSDYDSTVGTVDTGKFIFLKVEDNRLWISKNGENGNYEPVPGNVLSELDLGGISFEVIGGNIYAHYRGEDNRTYIGTLYEDGRAGDVIDVITEYDVSDLDMSNYSTQETGIYTGEEACNALVVAGYDDPAIFSKIMNDWYPGAPIGARVIVCSHMNPPSIYSHEDYKSGYKYSLYSYTIVIADYLGSEQYYSCYAATKLSETAWASMSKVGRSSLESWEDESRVLKMVSYTELNVEGQSTTTVLIDSYLKGETDDARTPLSISYYASESGAISGSSVTTYQKNYRYKFTLTMPKLVDNGFADSKAEVPIVITQQGPEGEGNKVKTFKLKYGGEMLTTLSFDKHGNEHVFPIPSDASVDRYLYYPDYNAPNGNVVVFPIASFVTPKKYAIYEGAVEGRPYFTRVGLNRYHGASIECLPRIVANGYSVSYNGAKQDGVVSWTYIKDMQRFGAHGYQKNAGEYVEMEDISLKITLGSASSYNLEYDSIKGLYYLPLKVQQTTHVAIDAMDDGTLGVEPDYKNDSTIGPYLQTRIIKLYFCDGYFRLQDAEYYMTVDPSRANERVERQWSGGYSTFEYTYLPRICVLENHVDYGNEISSRAFQYSAELIDLYDNTVCYKRGYELRGNVHYYGVLEENYPAFIEKLRCDSLVEEGNRDWDAWQLKLSGEQVDRNYNFLLRLNNNQGKVIEHNFTIYATV